MLQLYYAAGTCALASHIALAESGARYETVRLDFAISDQRKPDYLKLNPKGRVPLLVTDRGAFRAFPRPGSRRSTTPSPSAASRPSTPISAPPSTSPMPTSCAAIAGPTIRRRSRR